MRLKKFTYLLLILLGCTRSILLPATEPAYHPVDQKDWQKAVKGLDYTEVRPKPKEQKPEESQQPAAEHTATTYPGWLKYVGYFLIGGILVFILLKIFGKDLFSKRIKTDPTKAISLEDLDEKPMETELERFLREALAAKDYRLATRIYYLMVLKELNERKLISWKKNKTNFDYLGEMFGNNGYDQFNKQTKVFEYVWYGDKLLEENQFTQIRPSFQQFISTLTSKS